MNTRAILFSLCCAGLVLASLAGCSSWNKPASDSFASVIITNTTPVDVQAVTIKVFRESEYQLVHVDTNINMMTFEKEGTRGQSIAYNGIVGTQAGQAILNRVRVRLYERSHGNFRLSCQAYIVPDANSFATHEIKLNGMRSGPYEDLLEDIARRLNPPEK